MNSRFFLVLLLLICCLAPIQAQLDSLAQALPNMPNDTNKIEVLKKLALNYLYSDNKKSASYARQLSAVAEEIGDGHLQRYGRYVEGASLHYAGADEEALEILHKVMEDCRANEDKKLLAFCLNMLTFIHQSSYQTDLALEAIRECLEICLELDDKRMIAIAYHSTASTYEMIGENETSKNYLEKAIPIFEELGDQRGIGVMYQSMASLSLGQQSIDLAQKALEYLEGGFDVQAVGMCHWSIGGGYYELGEYEKSLESYQKALDIFQEIGFAEGEGQMAAHMGMILARVGRYEEGKPLLDRGHQLGKDLGYEDMFLYTHMGMAFYHAGKGNLDLTIAYIDSLNAIKDTIFNQEKAERLLFTEAQLQTKEKEAEIARQESKLQEASNTRNLILLTSIILILGILGIFLYLRSRQQQKQKAAELALSLEKAKAEQLTELDQLKSNFFANISHEFRTPLTLILGPLDQMRKGVFTGDQARYFELMQRNGQRLESLIDQLLDLSKLESEKMELQLESGDIHQFLRQLTASLESWTTQKEIKYQIDIPETPLWVDFDPDKLQKIVVNLLSNAIKFTPSGGQVTFLTQHSQEGQTAKFTLEVQDTGIGIPQELQSKIFERFYHIETSIDGMASSGIGLALVKELVEFQGGSVSMESEEGVSTYFRVERHWP
ncbi:MAG: tetratricopeptide repeat-containing sensor histidine kinase [Saprospiraceae bacterium]|nr:tetratricopeptide repeat-containing sensor histidine kinase [Saprospiraceae bacterium]